MRHSLCKSKPWIPTKLENNSAFVSAGLLGLRITTSSFLIVLRRVASFAPFFYYRLRFALRSIFTQPGEGRPAGSPRGEGVGRQGPSVLSARRGPSRTLLTLLYVKDSKYFFSKKQLQVFQLFFASVSFHCPTRRGLFRTLEGPGPPRAHARPSPCSCTTLAVFTHDPRRPHARTLSRAHARLRVCSCAACSVDSPCCVLDAPCSCADYSVCNPRLTVPVGGPCPRAAAQQRAAPRG